MGMTREAITWCLAQMEGGGEVHSQYKEGMN